MSDSNNIEKKFGKLVSIMERLRSKDGCPWDREQTHKSLRQYLLEEAYEVLELIDNEEYNELKNELGDLLLQVIFHAQIADENQLFNIETILDNINNKLIFRHPNVFGNVKIRTAAEQIVNWEKMKMKEGKKSVIDGVPKELSALLRAYRLQAKAATVGFDWPKIEPVWNKVDEEMTELKQAINENNHIEIEEEFGDLMFSLVNLARFLKVNPENALRNTIKKFITRFEYIEKEIKDKGDKIENYNLNELDAIWEKAKLNLKK